MAAHVATDAPMRFWMAFPCPPSSPRWRYLDDGRIDVDGEGVLRARSWPATMATWEAEVRRAAVRYHMPPHWLAAIMALESGGRHGVSSPSGTDVGLMQIQPRTASAMAGRHVSTAELLNDPVLNIDLGAKYLRTQMDLPKAGGDFVRGAVAYNAGDVRCGQSRTCTPTSWNVVMGCPSGKPNDYPRLAIGYANRALEEQYGGPKHKKQTPVIAVAGISAAGPMAAAALGALVGYVGVWLIGRRI